MPLVHCREAYAGAAGALTHNQNIGALIGEALKISDLQRLEVHGSAVELEQMKAPLKACPSCGSPSKSHSRNNSGTQTFPRHSRLQLPGRLSCGLGLVPLHFASS